MSGESGGGQSPAHRKETTGGSWGPSSTLSRGGPVSGGPSYSSITSINTSVRDKKNILEVRLEKQQGASFNLSMLETENLLKRLSMTSSQFSGVSPCPEGRPVVLITLAPGVDIARFLHRNECYVVKEGVRTTTIRQEGKKEKVVKVTGLHPNTKDQAVMKYLSAHGTVSVKDKVIHHVFPGEPGSTLLAGKENGNRSYIVELKVPMGSYHIIDGEKVSVRYGGQEWTCARCHQLKRNCPGAAVARNCTADRVLLSAHMLEHWQKIGYTPDTDALNEVDELLEVNVQVGGKKPETFVITESSLTNKYSSVIVKGFKPETPIADILEILTEHGGPQEYSGDDVVRNEKNGSLTVSNLKPGECLALVEKINRKRFFNRQIFVTSVVPESPIKTPPEPVVTASPEKHEKSNNDTGTAHNETAPAQPVVIDPFTGDKSKPTTNYIKPVTSSTQTLTPHRTPSSPSHLDKVDGLVFGLVSPGVQDKISQIENLKRKSEESPEAGQLSRKEKKILRGEEKRQKKIEKKQEWKEKLAVLNKTS